MQTIAAAYEAVRERVAAAAARSGRTPEAVTLVAVSKTRSVEEIMQVLEAGARDLGENYVQELVAKRKARAAKGPRDLRWHVIGTLQRNKVKYIAPFCALIHSLDSRALADEIERRAAQCDRKQPVLIEVNIAGETSKSGVSPAEAQELAEYVVGLTHVELRGLMTMTPYGASETECRRCFASLRQLGERLGRDLPPGAMAELSMGMTQDYEWAVEEGATIVRVGTAIFGPRSTT